MGTTLASGASIQQVLPAGKGSLLPPSGHLPVCNRHPLHPLPKCCSLTEFLPPSGYFSYLLALYRSSRARNILPFLLAAGMGLPGDIYKIIADYLAVSIGQFAALVLVARDGQANSFDLVQYGSQPTIRCIHPSGVPYYSQFRAEELDDLVALADRVSPAPNTDIPGMLSIILKRRFYLLAPEATPEAMKAELDCLTEAFLCIDSGGIYPPNGHDR